MSMKVTVDVDCLSGEGVKVATHSVHIDTAMLLKLGRFIVLQRGLLPDCAMDAFTVCVRIEDEA